MLKPGTGPPFYACVTLPCSTRYTLSNCFMNAPETSWVMATTMQGRASRFSMTCPLVSGSRLAGISSAMMRSRQPCNADALALPAREILAVLADEGVEAVGQGAHPVGEARRPDGVGKLSLGEVRAEADVAAEGVVEEIGGLGNVAHPLVEALTVDVPQLLAVEEDAAGIIWGVLVWSGWTPSCRSRFRLRGRLFPARRPSAGRRAAPVQRLRGRQSRCPCTQCARVYRWPGPQRLFPGRTWLLPAADGCPSRI